MSDVDRGFTLIEILVVVILLGILAVIVIPQFTNASNDAQEAALKSNLHRIRKQIELYRAEHHETYPSKQRFLEQMMTKTRPNGTAGGDLGPYLTMIPANPYNNDLRVKCQNNDNGLGDGKSGWHYNAKTGRFSASDSPEHAAW
jgi:type II secretion system protein G